MKVLSHVVANLNDEVKIWKYNSTSVLCFPGDPAQMFTVLESLSADTDFIWDIDSLRQTATNICVISLADFKTQVWKTNCVLRCHHFLCIYIFSLRSRTWIWAGRPSLPPRPRSPCSSHSRTSCAKSEKMQKCWCRFTTRLSPSLSGQCTHKLKLTDVYPHPKHCFCQIELCCFFVSKCYYKFWYY